MVVNEDQFWKFIDTAREAYSDVDALYEVLADQVWHLEPEDLKRFQGILDQTLANMNTRQLWQAARICLGEIDENIFLGFRCWLISRGKKALMNAIANPDSIADIPYEGKPQWGFGDRLVGLAGKAWFQWSESDENLPEELPESGVDFRAIPPGVDLSESQQKLVFPKLIGRFGT